MGECGPPWGRVYERHARVYHRRTSRVRVLPHHDV